MWRGRKVRDCAGSALVSTETRVCPLRRPLLLRGTKSISAPEHCRVSLNAVGACGRTSRFLEFTAIPDACSLLLSWLALSCVPYTVAVARAYGHFFSAPSSELTLAVDAPSPFLSILQWTL